MVSRGVDSLKFHRTCGCGRMQDFVQSLVDTFTCCRDGMGPGPGTKKSEAQRAMIKQVVETSSVFQHIAKDKIEKVIDAFRGPVLVSIHSVVIRQGDSCKQNDPCLFVLESGCVDVFVVKAGEDHEGSHVWTFDQPGQCFGQLALLFDVPRTASIIANSDSVLWHLDRETFQRAIDSQQAAGIVARHAVTVSTAGIHPQSVSPTFAIFDVNLTDPAGLSENLPRYYKLCKENEGLMCTLSCFSAWNGDFKRNASAKVIPAVRSSSEDNIRIFFFDDNIEWVGKGVSSGIVNLRNVEDASFVDFGDGDNGFRQEQFATNTVITRSPEWRNVIVQANILDAMEDEDYFNKIIAKSSKPGEKLLIFMDINSTIISVDSVSSKDMAQLVLGTMFEFITMVPIQPFTYQWRDTKRPPVTVKKSMHLKKLVKEICKDAKEVYDQFYTYDNCMQIIVSLVDQAVLHWPQQDGNFTLDQFKEFYERYLVTLVGGTSQEGITKSWNKCFEEQNAAGHSLVLNTFGMDSRKVILKTVSDERQVLQMCVSFEKWDAKDKALFNKMYGNWT